jgi:hypothetical protein
MRLLWTVIPLGALAAPAFVDSTANQESLDLVALAPADLAGTVRQSIDHADVKTTRTVSYVQTWNSNPANSQKIIQQLKDLTHEWNVGTTDMKKASGKVPESESDKFRQPMQHLEGRLDSLVTALLGRKREIDSIGLTHQMTDSCQSMKTAVDGFTKAVISRVADKKAGQYQSLHSSMVKKVDKAINGFKASAAGDRRPGPPPQPSQPNAPWQTYQPGPPPSWPPQPSTPSAPWPNQPGPQYQPSPPSSPWPTSQANPPSAPWANPVNSSPPIPSSPASPAWGGSSQPQNSSPAPNNDDGWDWSPPSQPRVDQMPTTLVTTIFVSPTSTPYN